MTEQEQAVIEAAKEFTRAWLESGGDYHFHERLAELEEKLAEATKPLMEGSV
jgi:hypothetical protein